MKIKVCGLKWPENIEQVIRLSPDYLGFIFYEKSPRYMVDTLNPEWVRQLETTARKIGVFVNESNERIKHFAEVYGLDGVQLHGHETPEDCQLMKDQGLSVIKVFHIGQQMEWLSLAPYIGKVDYFLFDTLGKSYGGSGKKFNWRVLEDYPFEVPYFLSGGIGLEDMANWQQTYDFEPFALDVNSRFEIEPGVKDISKLREMKTVLQ